MEEEQKLYVPVHADQGFGGLGISPEIIKVLTSLQFSKPTPIQHKAIPAGIQGSDIVGIAQTGTGKTLAFGIPMLQRLMASNNKRGLIILPTRELAHQVSETLMKIGKSFGLKTAVLIGGASMYQQVKELRGNPDIIIGTPGRINDHIERKTLTMHSVSILVLDEADLMFDMGFAPQIKQILQFVPQERQTLLFSATMPNDILKLATTYMKLPLRIEVAPPGTTAERVEHEIFFVQKAQKTPLLEKLLKDYKGSVLVFTRTKHGAKKICKDLGMSGFSAGEIHSNRSLSQRRMALDNFKTGKSRILVATDIASRGIDVKGIELVLNFDIPESAGDYVHRIGRTGRAGMAGKAITFVSTDQRNKVRDIERLIKTRIPVANLPDGLPRMEVPKQKEEYRNMGNRPFKKPFRKGNGKYPRFNKSY